VAFEQPLLVEDLGELADAGAQLLEPVEALDPQDLFLKRLQKRFDHAVGFELLGGSSETTSETRAVR
jgi:hypothetical protein